MSRLRRKSGGISTRSQSRNFGRRKNAPIAAAASSVFRDVASVGCLALAALAASQLARSAKAASSSWTFAGSGPWATSTNWAGSDTPGLTSGNTTSTDTATFNGSTAATITVDTARNIGSITFDTAAGNYTLSGGSLVLTSGGTIQIASTVTSTGKTETINTPITLEGNYAFANGNSTTTDVLNIGASGTITSAATAGVTTLTLAGVNTGSNVIDGIISNGGGSNAVALTKSGAGTWVLGANNTYTGLTTINQGTLTLDFTQASAPATNIISSSSSLAMGGGAGTATLNVIGASGATNSQTFNNTAFSQGASAFTINNNATPNPTLVSLGNLTRSEGATVNFTQPVNGAVSSINGYATGTGNTNGILGGWATVGGTDWAANNGSGNIVVYGNYTSVTGSSNPISGWASGQNISIDGTPSGGTMLNAGSSFSSPGVTTINSLRFTNAAATNITSGNNSVSFSGTAQGSATLTLSSGTTSGFFVGEFLGTTAGTLPSGAYITGIPNSTQITISVGTSNLTTQNWTAPAFTSELTLSSGGILLSSAVGNNTTTISNALLSGPTGGDIVINQENGTTTSHELTISSPIDNVGASPTGLTIAGTGYTLLSNFYSNFSGPLSVNGGTLEIDGPLTLGATYVGAGAILTQNPTTAAVAAENLTIGTLTGGGTVKYQSPSSTGNFVVNETSSSTFSGQITDADTTNSLATFTKNGAGTLTLNGAASAINFYRGLIIDAGTLTFAGAATDGNALSGNARNGLTINQTAVVTLDDTTTNTSNRLNAINDALTLNGGALNLLGSSSSATSETIATTGTSPASSGLVMGAGSDVIDATAGAGQSATLSFGSTYTRNAGATPLFEGTSLGSTPGSNVATIKISTAPTLTGGATAGNPSYGVMKGTFVDSITSGPTNAYSIATYDSTDGVRPLAGSETTGSLTAGDNVLVTGGTLTNNGAVINSLTLGTGGSIDNTAGTLTVTSGTILSTGATTSIGSGGGNTLQSGNTASTELVVYAAPSSALTIGSTISGNAGLTVGGAGTTTLTGNNSASLSGAITINGGILSISAANNLGNGNSTNTIALNNGGELQSTGASVTLGSGNITVGGTTANTITGGDIDVSGASTNTLTQGTGILLGVGSLTKTGIGTLVLNAANTYSGVTVISSGTLEFAKPAALYNGVTTSWTNTNIVVNPAATLAFNVGGASDFTSANIDTIRSNLSNATGGLENGAILGLDTTHGNFSYASVITDTTGGTLGLAKLGTNALTLTGANSYSGGTTINTGTLFANNATSSLGTGAVNINGGTLAGNGTINNGSNILTVNNGGTIGAGADGNHTATLTTGGQQWNAGGTFAVKINDTANATSGPGTGNGTAGAAVGWDEIAMSGLTLNGLSGNATTFAVTLKSYGSNTPSTAVSDFSNTSNYLWQIGAITATGLTSSATPVVLAQTDATGANISADSAGFTLDTSNFVTANSSTGTFALEGVDVGGNDQLSIAYNAAPEPGTAMLLMAGAGPVLLARRRRQSKRT